MCQIKDQDFVITHLQRDEGKKGAPFKFSILTLSSFLAVIATLLLFVCHTESVQQRNHWVGHKYGQKHPFCDQPMIPLEH